VSAWAHFQTAKALVADDKGRPAMDESNPTCNKFRQLERGARLSGAGLIPKWDQLP